MPLESSWGDLECNYCQSKRVFRIITMRWSSNSGVVDTPAGLRCADCHQDIDLPGMIAAIQLKAKKQELKAMEEEIRSRAITQTDAFPSKDDSERQKSKAGVPR